MEKKKWLNFHRKKLFQGLSLKEIKASHQGWQVENNNSVELFIRTNLQKKLPRKKIILAYMRRLLYYIRWIPKWHKTSKIKLKSLTKHKN